MILRNRFFLLIISLFLVICFTIPVFAQYEIVTLASRPGDNQPFYSTGFVWLGDFPPAIGVEVELVIVDPSSPEYAANGVIDCVENAFIDTNFALNISDQVFSDREYQKLLNQGFIDWIEPTSPLILASDQEQENSSVYFINDDDEPQLITNAPEFNPDLFKVNYQFYGDYPDHTVLSGLRTDSTTVMHIYGLDYYFNYSETFSYLTLYPELQCLKYSGNVWDPELYIYSFEPPLDSLSGWCLGHRTISDTINTTIDLELPVGAVPHKLVGARCSTFYNGLAWTETQNNTNGIGYYIIHKDSTGFIPVENEILRLEAYGEPINDTPLRSYLIWTEVSSDSIFLRQVLIDTNVDGVDENQNPLPADYAIQKAYPNPFNSSVRLGITLSQPARTELSVFDILGREVWNKKDFYQVGQHSSYWNAQGFPSGTYFARWQINGNNVNTQRLYLLK